MTSEELGILMDAVRGKVFSEISAGKRRRASFIRFTPLIESAAALVLSHFRLVWRAEVLVLAGFGEVAAVVLVEADTEEEAEREARLAWAHRQLFLIRRGNTWPAHLASDVVDGELVCAALATLAGALEESHRDVLQGAVTTLRRLHCPPFVARELRDLFADLAVPLDLVRAELERSGDDESGAVLAALVEAEREHAEGVPRG